MSLKIRAGYDIAFQCVQELPMILMLSVRLSRQRDLLTEHVVRFSRGVTSRDYRDAFGNNCTRLVARRSQSTRSALARRFFLVLFKSSMAAVLIVQKKQDDYS